MGRDLEFGKLAEPLRQVQTQPYHKFDLMLPLPNRCVLRSVSLNSVHVEYRLWGSIATGARRRLAGNAAYSTAVFSQPWSNFSPQRKTLVIAAGGRVGTWMRARDQHWHGDRHVRVDWPWLPIALTVHAGEQLELPQSFARTNLDLPPSC